MGFQHLADELPTLNLSHRILLTNYLALPNVSDSRLTSSFLYHDFHMK